MCGPEQENELSKPARMKLTDDRARIDTRTWTEAALEALAEQGIDGVRVELLAKRLGITKGSFYWHFADRGALFEAMLEEWRRDTTLDIIVGVERADESCSVRLRKLLRLPLAGRKSEHAANVELSIRVWARRYPKAQAVLEEIDQLRLRYLSGLLEGCGVNREEATARAVLAYAYMRVATTLIGDQQTELMEQCENILLNVDLAPLQLDCGSRT
jgi:AcrR family transcriptional regulator